MTILDIPRSLVFQQPFTEAAPPDPSVDGPVGTTQTLEGLWWKHDPGVDGFLNLANHTDRAMEVTVQTVGARGTWLLAQALTLSPHVTKMLDLDQLTGGLPGLETQQGGLRIQYTGGLGEVGVGGGLENAQEGYSANMIFWSRDAASSPKAITLAAVGLQAGDADPAAGFPGGTRFAPYVALRNTTSNAVDISAVLYTATSGQAGVFPLPAGQLKPYESRQFDLAESLDALGLKSLNGNVNLKLSYTGAVGDVVMAAGSTDQTGNYVFEVLPQGVETSLAKEIPYWTVANGFDTALTLWNSSGQGEDLVATFYFAGGAGQYRLPLHLDAYASLNLDLAQLIAAQRPDAEGRVIPLDAKQGSAMISSPKGLTEPIQLNLNALVFNVSTATCSYWCICCSGVIFIASNPNPAFCPVGLTAQMTAKAHYNNGSETVITSSASWTSSNTAVATVNNSTAKGLVTGVAVGTSTIKASATLTFGGLLCAYNPFCGGSNGFSGSSTENVLGVPTNFRQVGPGTDTGGGNLHFSYAWDSSTGNLADLSACSIYEFVKYPTTANPYVWPKPPWDGSSPNPTATFPVGAVDARLGKAVDDNETNPFIKPYAEKSFIANQTFKYHCGGLPDKVLLGPLDIARSVSKKTDGKFMYKITKSQAQAVVDPLS